MEIKKETVRKIATKYVPLFVGMCSSSLIGRALKGIVPEPEKLSGKIMDKLGRYGVGVAVSSIVLEKTSEEFGSFADPILDVIFRDDEVKEINPVSQDEIKEHLDKGHKMVYDPVTDEITFEEGE